MMIIQILDSYILYDWTDHMGATIKIFMAVLDQVMERLEMLAGTS